MARTYAALISFAVVFSGNSSLAGADLKEQAEKALAKMDCRIAAQEASPNPDPNVLDDLRSKRRITSRLWKAKGVILDDTPYIDSCEMYRSGFSGAWEYREEPNSGTWKIEDDMVEYIPGSTIPASCSAIVGQISKRTDAEISGIVQGFCRGLLAIGRFEMRHDDRGYYLSDCLSLSRDGSAALGCDIGYFREVERLSPKDVEKKHDLIVVQ